MAATPDPQLIFSKRKAISALLPHAIFLEQRGQQGMINAIFRAARASKDKDFIWEDTVPYVSKLFGGRSPASLNRVIVYISPYLSWNDTLNSSAAVARWAEATLAVQYTEELGQSIVSALFKIASVPLLQSHVPIGVWRLLKRQPLPLPRKDGRIWGNHTAFIGYIRRLGDTEILKSYFLAVWTYSRSPPTDVVNEMESTIREDFSGPGMEADRKELIGRLNQILKGDLMPHDTAREKYATLRDVLLVMDK